MGCEEKAPFKSLGLMQVALIFHVLFCILFSKLSFAERDHRSCISQDNLDTVCDLAADG